MIVEMVVASKLKLSSIYDINISNPVGKSIVDHSDLKKTLLRKKCAWHVTIMESFSDI